MKRLETIAAQWNDLENDKDRWEYMLKHKGKIGVMLDNDSTDARFRESIIPDDTEDYDDLPRLNSFDNWIGNDSGIYDLMSVLGIHAEGA